MKEKFCEELEALQKEVLATLRNKLVFIRTLSEIANPQELSAEKLSSVKKQMDECLLLIEAKFIEARNRFEQVEHKRKNV